MTNAKLKLSLFALRVSIFLVTLIWVINQLLNPSQAIEIFEGLSNMPDYAIYVIGTIELILISGFLLGIFKTVTYGAVLLIQAVSVFSLIDEFFKPFSGSNMMLLAYIPMFAACVMLFLLRRKDTFLSLQ